MATEIKVPVLPESVADGTIAALHVSVGDSVAVDDNLIDIETEKVVLEVPSSISGVVSEIHVEVGDTVEAQQLVISVNEGSAAQSSAETTSPAPESQPQTAASIEIHVPVLPESVAEGTLVTWHKNIGDTVAVDDNLVDIETEKVVLEVPSPVNGVLTEIKVEAGSTVEAQQFIAIITEGAAAEGTATTPSIAAATSTAAGAVIAGAAEKSGPAVRKMINETGIDASNVAGTGKDGRLTKADVASAAAKPATTTSAKAPAASTSPAPGERGERREPMSRIRSTIARRLKDAQNTQAMLTTFNDVDLSAVMKLRRLS